MKQIFVDWRSFNGEAKNYLITQFLLAGYYTWPFWFGYATERISTSQFGIYLAVAYVVGLVAEVPTGAFADKFGRKKSAMTGAFLMSSYAPIVYFGDNFTAYIVAAIVGGIGSAFISGSLESIVYESRGVDKRVFRKIMQYELIFWQAGLIISSAIGGVMYSVDHILPFLAQTLSFVLALVFISRVQDAVKKRSYDEELLPETAQGILHTSKTFLIHNRDGFRHLFSHKLLWPVIIFGTTISSIAWLGIENINEALMIHHGFVPNQRGIIIALTKLGSLLLVSFVVYKVVYTDLQKLTFLFIALLSSSMVYSLDEKTLFFLGFLLFNMVSSSMSNFIRPILHDHISNQYRATAISSYSFLINLSVAVCSIFIGKFLETRSVITVEQIIVMIILVVALPALIKSRNYLKAYHGGTK